MSDTTKAESKTVPTAVIKIGGRTLEEESLRATFAADICSLTAGWRLIMVHGGGPEVSALSKRLSYIPRFQEGIRITSPEEMEVVDMVLAGSANKRLVRVLSAAGVHAVGICGSDGPTIVSQLEESPAGTRTGTVKAVDTHLLSVLMATGFVPVVSPVCDDGAGAGVNVNADTVACQLATAIETDILVFISDIDGVRKSGAVLPYLGSVEAESEIVSGTITDGMIPKIRSSIAAVEAGVGRVHIGDYTGSGALQELLDGKRGTILGRGAGEDNRPIGSVGT